MKVLGRFFVGIVLLLLGNKKQARVDAVEGARRAFVRLEHLDLVENVCWNVYGQCLLEKTALREQACRAKTCNALRSL